MSKAHIVHYYYASGGEVEPEQYLLDTFTAANGTAIAGRAPDVGNIPTIISGTHAINSNAMTSTAAGLVSWNVEHADFEFEVSLRVSTTDEFMRMDLRLADNTASATHRLVVDFTATDARLREWNDSASVTNTWTTPFPHPAINTDYTIRAVANGSNIKIYVDDELLIDETTGVITGNYVAIFGNATAGSSVRSTHYVSVYSV